MFAQILMTLAVTVGVAYVLWRFVATPIVRSFSPPSDDEVTHPRANARADELLRMRDELEGLELETELAKDIRALEPRLERLRTHLQEIDARDDHGQEGRGKFSRSCCAGYEDRSGRATMICARTALARGSLSRRLRQRGRAGSFRMDSLRKLEPISPRAGWPRGSFSRPGALGRCSP